MGADWDDRRSESFEASPEKTAGKTIFVKFFAPWCGHCKSMKPAWDKLMEDYKEHSSILVADVDCVGDGKTKCDEVGIKNFPSIKYGNPNNLEDYTGGRDLPSLQKFAQESLRPTCGPENIDLCDVLSRKQLEEYMAMPADELNSKIREQEASITAAEKEVDELLKSMQKEYEEAKIAKEIAFIIVLCAALCTRFWPWTHEISQGASDQAEKRFMTSRMKGAVNHIGPRTGRSPGGGMRELSHLTMTGEEVRIRRAQGKLSASGREDPERCQSSCATERSEERSATPSRPGFEFDGKVPKYLKLSCVLKPRAQQPPPRRRRRRPRALPQHSEADAAAAQEALNIVVAEAATPIRLRGAGGEVRLPAETWLVLDAAAASRLPEVVGDLPLGSEASGHKAFVLEKFVPALRLLEDAQLNWAAAQANFVRCSRGACFLALKHAAFVLKVLATRHALDETEAQGVDNLPQLRTVLADIDDKVSRAAGLVGSRAAAAMKRPETPPPRLVKPKPDKNEVAPEAPSPRHTALRRGLQAQTDFTAFANRRFGNCVRLWFVLDPEEHLKLANKQFVRGCEEIGFSGCLTTLWRQLDHDGSGSILFSDIDPESAMQLADLKVIFTQQFEGSAEKFMKSVDSKGSHRASKDEFVRAMDALNCPPGTSRRLFDLLCRYNCTTISVKDLLFLQRWTPPPFYFVRGDLRLLNSFRSALAELHGSALRAWFRLWDPDQLFRISWFRFRLGVANIARRHGGLPNMEEDAAKVWRTLDEECFGWATLRTFYPEAFEAATRLKRWATLSHGSVAVVSVQLVLRSRSPPVPIPGPSEQMPLSHETWAIARRRAIHDKVSRKVRLPNVSKTQEVLELQHVDAWRHSKQDMVAMDD
ncbi:SEP2 [Symbiodinium necroappetens]|uniref:SEP2 protein n=1 Tax=Symbiodinium necroappetens TaxID=1628268 RepID=A0A813B8R5_9DINO|nr:SEP2 [Symbiodinium necroappetens]